MGEGTGMRGAAEGRATMTSHAPGEPLQRPSRRPDDPELDRHPAREDRTVARRVAALHPGVRAGNEKERRDWLKAEHRLGTNTAWWIAERSVGKGEEDVRSRSLPRPGPRLRGRQCSRAAKPPCVRSTTSCCPRSRAGDRTSRPAPARRSSPSTATTSSPRSSPPPRRASTSASPSRTLPATGRLIDTGGFAKKDRITHRIPITSLAEIDDEVRQLAESGVRFGRLTDPRRSRLERLLRLGLRAVRGAGPRPRPRGGAEGAQPGLDRRGRALRRPRGQAAP